MWREASGQWHSEILALTANIHTLIGKGELLLSAGEGIMEWRLRPNGTAYKMYAAICCRWRVFRDGVFPRWDN